MIESADHLLPVLSLGYRVARIRGEILTLLVISRKGGERPDWLVIPADFDESTLVIRLISGVNPAADIIRLIHEQPPTILGFGLDEYNRDSRYMLSASLDSILHRANCPTAIIKASSDWQLHPGKDDIVDVFVPFWNDANSRYAINLALAIDPSARVTAGILTPSAIDQADQHEREQALERMTEDWAEEARFSAQLLSSDDETASLLDEASRHDITLLGASRGQSLARAVFGDPRNELFERNSGPTVLLREYQGSLGALLHRALTRWDRWMPKLSMEERIEVYRQVRRGARPRQDFFMMIALSAGIAALGLILNSAAVIIGAMLVAPLMSAIIGMGLGTVQGNSRFIATAARAMLLGALVAIAMGFLLGLIHFDREPTSEMLGRAAPSILDLMVAVVSGFAGAYALCRSDVSSSLPGVAIAVALVPPLATVGLFMSMLDWDNAAGALLLFLTNLIAITFASAVVFVSMGFRPPPLPPTEEAQQHKVFKQSFLTAGVLVVVLAVILIHLSAIKIQDTANREIVRQILNATFNPRQDEATIFDWNIDRDGNDGLRVTVAVGMPGNIESSVVQALQTKLATELKQPLTLSLSVVPTQIVGNKDPVSTTGLNNPINTVTGQ